MWVLDKVDYIGYFSSNMAIVISETQRLVIRAWELADTQALSTLTREAGLSEFSASGYENYSLERAHRWIKLEMARFARNRQGKFAVIHKDTNSLIGVTGIFQMPAPHENEVEINYRFPVRWRGKGFGLEVARAIVEYGFNDLGIQKINAVIDSKNTSSQKLVEKLGMSRVGTIHYQGIEGNRWFIQSS